MKAPGSQVNSSNSDERDTVVQFDIGCTPELACPGPIIMLAEDQAIFSFNASRVLSDKRREDAGRAIIKVPACLALRFCSLDDDDLCEGIAVYEVLNSSWLSSVDADDSYDHRHLIFPFHNSTLELLCGEIQLEYTENNSTEQFAEMAAWINAFH